MQSNPNVPAPNPYPSLTLTLTLLFTQTLVMGVGWVRWVGGVARARFRHGEGGYVTSVAFENNLYFVANYMSG